jgi:transcriptional regulator with XRE-family HTH domain
MLETPTRRRSSRAYPSLRAYFELTGTRQLDVAKDAGISEAHLSNIINGKRTPSYHLALVLSRLTNVPVESVSAQD